MKDKATAAANSAYKAAGEAAKQGKAKMDSTMNKSSNKKTPNPDDVAQLQGMGFSADEASAALIQTGGDVQAAIAVLCEEPAARAAQPARAPPVASEYQPGVRVRLKGLQRDPGLNGKQGVLEKLDDEVAAAVEGKVTRWTVRMGDGTQLRLKPENLEVATKKVSTSDKMMSSLKSGQASMLDTKRRAEAYFSGNKMSSSSTAPPPVTSTSSTQRSSGATSESAEFWPPPRSTDAARRANAEAAERRLTDARARNAGTMEDWRRWRDSHDGRQQREQRKTATEDRPLRQPREQAAVEKPQGSDTSNDSARAVDGDVPGYDLDLQRAIAASMAHAGEAGDPKAPNEEDKQAVPQPASTDEMPRHGLEDRHLQAAVAASLSEQSGNKEKPQPTSRAAVAASTAAAAAAEYDEDADQEDENPFAEDPELFETNLRAAIAEEELSLQRALAMSLQEERAALERLQKTSREAHLSAENTPEKSNTSEGVEPSVAAAAAAVAVDGDLDAQLEEVRVREEKVQAECKATEEEFAQLREAQAALIQEQTDDEDVGMDDDANPFATDAEAVGATDCTDERNPFGADVQEEGVAASAEDKSPFADADAETNNPFEEAGDDEVVHVEADSNPFATDASEEVVVVTEAKVGEQEAEVAASAAEDKKKSSEPAGAPDEAVAAASEGDAKVDEKDSKEDKESNDQDAEGQAEEAGLEQTEAVEKAKPCEKDKHEVKPTSEEAEVAASAAEDKKETSEPSSALDEGVAAASEGDAKVDEKDSKEHKVSKDQN